MLKRLSEAISQSNIPSDSLASEFFFPNHSHCNFTWVPSIRRSSYEDPPSRGPFIRITNLIKNRLICSYGCNIGVEAIVHCLASATQTMTARCMAVASTNYRRADLPKRNWSVRVSGRVIIARQFTAGRDFVRSQASHRYEYAHCGLISTTV
jgi:hypothetical protein